MKDMLDRRNFLKGLGFGAAAIALPGCMSDSRRRTTGSSRDKPNIILITVSYTHLTLPTSDLV